MWPETTNNECRNTQMWWKDCQLLIGESIPNSYSTINMCYN